LTDSSDSKAPIPIRDYYGLKEAASLLGISRYAIMGFVYRGKLQVSVRPSLKNGRPEMTVLHADLVQLCKDEKLASPFGDSLRPKTVSDFSDCCWSAPVQIRSKFARSHPVPHPERPGVVRSPTLLPTAETTSLAAFRKSGSGLFKYTVLTFLISSSWFGAT